MSRRGPFTASPGRPKQKRGSRLTSERYLAQQPPASNSSFMVGRLAGWQFGRDWLRISFLCNSFRIHDSWAAFPGGAQNSPVQLHPFPAPFYFSTLRKAQCFSQHLHPSTCRPVFPYRHKTSHSSENRFPEPCRGSSTFAQTGLRETDSTTRASQRLPKIPTCNTEVVG